MSAGLSAIPGLVYMAGCTLNDPGIRKRTHRELPHKAGI